MQDMWRRIFRLHLAWLIRNDRLFLSINEVIPTWLNLALTLLMLLNLTAAFLNLQHLLLDVRGEVLIASEGFTSVG